MNEHKRHIKIFISSPNDLLHEREVCRQSISQMNEMIGEYFSVTFSSYTWENSIEAVGMGNPMSRVPSPSEYDIYIGMLWNHFGTHTKHEDNDGIEYQSGTFEEFMNAYNSFVEKKSPEVLFFRKLGCEKETDSDQKRKIDGFFSNFSTDGAFSGIYGTFAKDDELAHKVRSLLMHYVIMTNPNTKLHSHYRKAGLVDLYIPSDNSVRNEQKRKTIENYSNTSVSIKLLAHTGNSYLSDMAQRFTDSIISCLERGIPVEVVIANPYSIMGCYLTVCETARLQSITLLDALHILKNENIVKAIQKSQTFSIKWTSAIQGYEFMRRKYGDLIKLKISNYEINSTILIVGDDAFVEPYFYHAAASKQMDAFEVLVSSQKNTYNIHNSINQYYSLLWDMSDDYDYFLAHEKEYQKSLQKWFASQEKYEEIIGSVTNKDIRIEIPESKLFSSKSITNDSINLIIPDGTLFIDNATFSNNHTLQNIIIPEGVVYIGREAFLNCVNLVNVKLPSSLKYIDEKAFYGCEKLREVYVMPDTVLGKEVFCNCSQITVFCAKKSYAAIYCKNNHLRYVIVKRV